ncbi:carbohydrate ABC transporter permease [Sinorhizobium fredii]|uniref:Sugar ABC transporter permease protein n=1 Tax=Rhizobium fredii TaxID=380 RepID=A0A2L0HD65_RHIFR|nr:carbohydrate ABC transporter permease [Sinorhizobium fredii]AUX79357.1 sugar ABC transporter permease protein [Sinorhizobium fredii]
MERRSTLATVLTYLAANVVFLIVVAPFIWLVIMSISPAEALSQKPLRWWPSEVDFSNYHQLLDYTGGKGRDFLSALFNSIRASGAATLLALIVAVPAAWVVSRVRSMGWSLSVVVLLYMLPPVALAVPLYMVLARLGMLNSVLGLAAIYLAILAPFTTWLIKSGFDALPGEIESAASMDGARLDQMLRLISIPLIAPIISTAAIFALLLAWDEFFYALLFTSGVQAKTVTVAIAEISGGRETNYGAIAAAGVIAALPPVFIGLVLQKALISGLTQGGVKG